MSDWRYHGYDMSAMQGSIGDFTALNADFIIYRCGVGNDYIDSTFAGSRTAIKKVNIPFLPYHFPYIMNLSDDSGHKNRTPLEQAALHYNACESNAALDIEWPSLADWPKYGITSPNILTDWVMQYIQCYQQLSGCVPIIYTYPFYAAQGLFEQCPDLANYPLWIASYEQTPVIPKPWTSAVIWQTSGSGTKLPNGITVDTDVCNDLSIFD